jgi:anti-anti-sigma factor
MNGTDLVALDLHVEHAVPVCVIRGELDASNVDEVLNRLATMVPSDASGIVLDMTDTRYLDSAGVRMLFEMARKLRARRQELRLVVPVGGIVRRVLVLTALADVVPIDDDAETAAGVLASRV